VTMRRLPTDVLLWERSPQRLRSEQVRISVIIPTLEEEKALPRLLARFDDTTIQRFGIELIISDGGSKDATAEIARTHADVVAVHASSRRQTIAEGRNVGACLARGQTLVFLNADCVPANWQCFWQTIAEWTAERGRYLRFGVLAGPVEVHPAERRWRIASCMGVSTRISGWLQQLGLALAAGNVTLCGGGFSNKQVGMPHRLLQARILSSSIACGDGLA